MTSSCRRRAVGVRLEARVVPAAGLQLTLEDGVQRGCRADVRLPGTSRLLMGRGGSGQTLLESCAGAGLFAEASLECRDLPGRVCQFRCRPLLCLLMSSRRIRQPVLDLDALGQRGAQLRFPLLQPSGQGSNLRLPLATGILERRMRFRLPHGQLLDRRGVRRMTLVGAMQGHFELQQSLLQPGADPVDARQGNLMLRLALAEARGQGGDLRGVHPAVVLAGELRSGETLLD